MTTSMNSPISLDEARERFLKAESTLNDLTESLKSLRSAAERFDEGNAGLRGAGERLVSLSDQFAGATQRVASGIELMGQALDILEKSEPARVLTALDHLEKVVEGVGTVLRSSAEGMTRQVEGLEEVLKSVVSSTEAAESRDVAHLDAVRSALSEMAESHVARLSDTTASVQQLTKALTLQRVELDGLRKESAVARKWMLGLIVGIGIVLVVLELVQLLR